MSARHKARKRALDVLFEAEARGLDAALLLADRQAAAAPPVADFAAELVTGVHAHQQAIDALLASHLQPGWTLGRLPAVDRAALRLGCYELRFAPSPVPPAVALSEAVALVAELSTDDSPAFVNGVLGAINAATDPGAGAAATPPASCERPR